VIAALAAAAGVAIDNAGLYEDTRRRQRLSEAISRINQAMLGGADTDEIIALLARQAAELTDADSAMISLPAHDGVSTLVEAVYGLAEGMLGQQFPVEGTVTGQVLTTGKTLVLANIASSAGSRQATQRSSGFPAC